MTLIEELRSKKSRDNRELLDRAADRIEELERSQMNKQNEIIKEFSERLKKYFNSLNGRTPAALVAYHIDEISKEIMEREGTE